MKNLLIAGSILVVLLIAFGVAGFAFAQAQNPPTPQPPAGDEFYQNFPGMGMMGGNRAGMMGWMRGFRQGRMGAFGRGFMQGAFGPMHEFMVAALAERLGVTVDELNARIASGERPLEIARAQGMTVEQIQGLMEEAHDEALKAAVAAGALTQEQAAAMDQHMELMWKQGGMGGMFGARGCPGMGGSIAPQP